MVFKTLNVAHRSIFKAFAHGHVQALVAASQTSYASHYHPFNHFGNSLASRFAHTGSLAHHNAYTPGQLSSGAKVTPNEQDSGLKAYYAAWQKYQKRDEDEWKQFQFVKRIEWKPSSLVNEKETTARDEHVSGLSASDEAARPILGRSASESAVDILLKDPSKRARASGLVNVEPASSTIATVDEANADQVLSAATADVSKKGDNDTAEISARSIEGDLSARHSVNSPSLSILESTPATSVSELDVYTEHLVQLAEAQDFVEIPKVFHAILVSGTKPTTCAYNALLTAKINLSPKHHVVPDALDVFTQMRKTHVRPDFTTYSILIELLAARSLEVGAMKEDMEDKRMRYGGLEEPGQFMFMSNEADFEMLTDDDSLALALRFFKKALADKVGSAFPEQTYRLLIKACAEGGRVDDMVDVYSQMASRDIAPCTDLFVPMITAFARSGDLRSAVDCYQEYKALAVANNRGDVSMSRKDEDVYAALIRAYSMCGKAEDASSFFGKVEKSLAAPEDLQQLHNIVGPSAFVPQWLHNRAYDDALEYAVENLVGTAQQSVLASIATHAADRNHANHATTAYNQLVESTDKSGAAIAMSAMHFRNGYPVEAEPYLSELKRGSIRTEFVELAAMQCMAAIGSGDLEGGAREVRSMFSWIRSSQTGSKQAKAAMIDQIDEAIETIGHFMIKRGIILPANATMELFWAQIENGDIVPPLAVHLLSGLGPEAIAELHYEDVNTLIQVQSSLIVKGPNNVDMAHSTRFSHILKVITSTGMPTSSQTVGIVEKVLIKIDRPDLSQRWQMYRYPPIQEPVFGAITYHENPVASPIASTPAPAFDDSFDPYAAATDNKGSVAINELLDKAHGKPANHLNEALTRFKHMRKAGRHPRFYTYSRLIGAAAREGRLGLAQDIIAMARQDVPFQPQYRIVRFGWVTMLDSMVAACLNTGRRDLAAQHHQELLDMGAAPSANTFGLYITTLKESTKTFDEASEAVKIFARAKSEGVEPSSFLYNALIGKLGKARRIDDCLFYFGEMRTLGIRPTSVTYGTIVNALCRVSDEKFAEELFDEMESMPNYKPRPAPYHSMMQFFLTTKRERSKVLSYYQRMKAHHIRPTPHTYKLLIDTFASLEPLDMSSAEAVLNDIRSSGAVPEAVHYSSLIHARGCVQHDVDGAKELFDTVLAEGRVRPQPCLYQALFEGMVANHRIADTEAILKDMRRRGVEMTPYIANSLIHGWTMIRDISKARAIYDSVSLQHREPSTYEAMTRAYLAVEDRISAKAVVNEGLSRGYPAAVAHKILDLVGGNSRGFGSSNITPATEGVPTTLLASPVELTSPLQSQSFA